MILILFNTVVESYWKCFNELNFMILKHNHDNDKHLINIKHFKCSRPLLIFLSKFNSSLYQPPKQLLIKDINHRFIYRNLWQKFINKYWQETIFISKPSLLSENYINKLKKSGLSVYTNNDYKNFLIDFSKALLNGKVQVSIDNSNMDTSIFIYANDIYLKYIWRKGLSFPFNNFIKTQQNRYKLPIANNKYIKYNSLPIFAIANQDNQLIMAESSERILSQKNNLSLFSNNFNLSLFKEMSSKKVYTGLLFINPEDASEYKEYIISQYYNSSRINNITSFVGQLNLYYQLLYASLSNTEFKLIPDLKEVSELIYKYRYYKNIFFSREQKYGKNYFKGQPIYIIKPISAVNKKTKEKHSLDYFYYINKNHKISKYQAIFLNYKTAIYAWDKFKIENCNYKLPKKPLLYVYNLEEFLKNYKKNDTNIIFVPSSDTYKFIKKNIQLKKINSINKILINNTLYLKNFITKAIWSLTSKHPTNW